MPTRSKKAQAEAAAATSPAPAPEADAESPLSEAHTESQNGEAQDETVAEADGAPVDPPDGEEAEEQDASVDVEGAGDAAAETTDANETVDPADESTAPERDAIAMDTDAISPKTGTKRELEEDDEADQDEDSAMPEENQDEAEDDEPVPHAPRTTAPDRTLKDFLKILDTHAPIIPDAVTDYYLSQAGFECDDPRVKRLLALAAQKFVSDIAQDAYQHSKIRASGTTGGGAGGAAGLPGVPAAPKSGRFGKDRGRAVLTMDDLGAAVQEYGINIKRQDFMR